MAFLERTIASWGYAEVVVQSDGEPAISSIMEALKKSVAEAGARKMAPSVKSAKKTAKKRSSKKATSRKKKTG